MVSFTDWDGERGESPLRGKTRVQDEKIKAEVSYMLRKYAWRNFKILDFKDLNTLNI